MLGSRAVRRFCFRSDETPRRQVLQFRLRQKSRQGLPSGIFRTKSRTPRGKSESCPSESRIRRDDFEISPVAFNLLRAPFEFASAHSRPASAPCGIDCVDPRSLRGRSQIRPGLIRRPPGPIAGARAPRGWPAVPRRPGRDPTSRNRHPSRPPPGRNRDRTERGRGGGRTENISAEKCPWVERSIRKIPFILLLAHGCA